MNAVEKQPTAIVLVIDQLSASMLGPYGNTLYETDGFNRIAGDGLLYDFAFADSTKLFAGYDALWKPAGTTSNETPNQSTLLAQLADQGIQSVLMTDDPRLADHPLAAFDRIVSVSDESTSATSKSSADSAAETQLGNFFAQAAILIAELEPGSLVWLHSRGLAGDWDAPYGYRIRLADDDDPPPPTFVDSPAKWIDPDTADPDELLGLQQAAAAQVFLVDELLGVLLDVLQSNPFWQTTLFCLASPRGCGLGEHGLVGTGDQLYFESVQVPFIVRVPGDQSLKATRCGSLTSISTLSQIVGNWFSLDQNSFSASMDQLAPVRPDETNERILISSEEQDSIQTHAWKLIRSKMGGGVQLFTKPDDRTEVNDVADRCPDAVGELLEIGEELL